MLRRSLLAALAAAVILPVSDARASWGSDAKLVKRGLARAVQRGWVLPYEASDYRATLRRAGSTWRRLPGSRSTNLAAVLHDVGLEWRAYIAPRALALFSMLDTNTRYLGSDPMPRSGTDILDADGVVYRSFPGQGLQFHPLGNFGRLNSLLAHDDSADAAILAAALISRAIPRKGTLVWEYYFPFGGGRPPWTSGMVQAVAARAFAADDDLDVARKAFLALQRLTFGVSGGVWVRLYSFSNLAVLNAQLQSALSLSSYAQLNYDDGAAQLADRLLQTADSLFPRFDTGAWSLYALGGSESPLNYHLYDIGLMKRIAAAWEEPVWTTRAERFESYTTEPPILKARGPSHPVRWRARIRLWISKISRVTLRIGHTTETFTLSRGLHNFYWRAKGRRAGRYTVRLSAVDLAGNRAAKAFPLFVRRR